MSYKIVVARYNENIEWLNEELNNCIIYNKGGKLNIEQEICLENVGRESETYLRYIIDNYYNLPDVVVFTQGRISDHIDLHMDDINHLRKLRDQAFTYGKSRPTAIYHQPAWREQCAWDKEWNVEAGHYFLHDCYKNNRRLAFGDWFRENVNANYPNPISIYVFAIFAVRREKILKRTLEYYKELIEHANHNINPAEGHFFERSWFHIFE